MWAEEAAGTCADLLWRIAMKTGPVEAPLGMRQGTSMPQVSAGGCYSQASHRRPREAGDPLKHKHVALGDIFFFLK